jgi:hypothetical protein
MPTLLSRDSQMARYLLGDLTPDESSRIEDAMRFDQKRKRELEAAEEELTAAYVVGMLRGEDRVKFEADFLSSEERARKLMFAKAWFEKSRFTGPDLSLPLHRFILGDMAPGEMDEVEQKLLSDGRYRGELEAAEDELLMAYFEGTLPGYERELFEVNYLINDRIFRKLRFAHIMREYVKLASVAPAPATEKAVANRRAPQ